MQVINVHKRLIHQSKFEIDKLIETLATGQDQVWPSEQWPKMKFRNGFKEGSKGGHGPIRYTLHKHIPGELIQFKFTNPKGFDGIHKFETSALAKDKVELKHTIDMVTSGSATFMWMLGIRWLHDALIEDLYDKIENHFGGKTKKTKWNFWVRFLRKVLN